MTPTTILTILLLYTIYFTTILEVLEVLKILEVLKLYSPLIDSRPAGPLKIVALVVAMVLFALILVRSGQVVLFGRSVGRWSLYRSVARFPPLKTNRQRFHHLRKSLILWR